MTPNFQLIKDALTHHCLDSLGNIYTITLDDIVDYIEKELSPAMKDQLAALDEVSLALEIADAIGNVGIVELIEGAICEAIKTQIEIAREAIGEARTYLRLYTQQFRHDLEVAYGVADEVEGNESEGVTAD